MTSIIILSLHQRLRYLNQELSQSVGHYAHKHPWQKSTRRHTQMPAQTITESTGERVKVDFDMLAYLFSSKWTSEQRQSVCFSSMLMSSTICCTKNQKHNPRLHHCCSCVILSAVRRGTSAVSCNVPKTGNQSGRTKASWECTVQWKCG